MLITNVRKFDGGDLRKRQNGATVIQSWFGDGIDCPVGIIKAFHSLPASTVNREDEEPT